MTCLIWRKRPSTDLNNSSYLANRIFFIVLLVFCLGNKGWARENAFQIIRSGTYEGLADELGEVLIPPVYDKIGWTDGDVQVKEGLIGYLENEKWGLISIKNKQITSPNYDVLTPFSEGLFKAAIRGKFSNELFHGLIDHQGKSKLEFRYFSLDNFQPNLTLASTYKNRQVSYGLIEEGHVLIPIIFDHIEPLGDLILCHRKKKQKLFDRQGKELFDTWLDKVVWDEEGYKVCASGKWGFADLHGHLVYAAAYKTVSGNQATAFPRWEVQKMSNQEVIGQIHCDSITVQGAEHLLIHLNGQRQLMVAGSREVMDLSNRTLLHIHRDHLLFQEEDLTYTVTKLDGETVLAEQDHVLLDSIFFFGQMNYRWNIYNYYGRKVNERSLNEIGAVVENNVAVNNHGYWGWMNYSGQLVMDYKYDALAPGLQSNQFLVSYIDQWGVADFHGEYIILPEFERIENRGGLYVGYRGLTKQIFDSHGKLIYVTGDDLLADDYLQVCTEEGNLLILPSGRITPAYEDIFHVDGYHVLYRNGLVTVIDDQMRVLIDSGQSVQEVMACSEGYFLIRKDGLAGFMDQQGRLRIANRYDQAKPYADGMAAFKLRGKWGFIDKQEKLSVQPFYDQVSDFQDGLAIVRIGKQYGIINKDGEEVVKLEWKSIRREQTGNFVLEGVDGVKGLVDTAGALILSPIFEELSDHPSGLVIAKKNGQLGLLDYQGFTVLPFQYTDIRLAGDVILLKE